MSNALTVVTDDDFDAIVLESPVPVLVDFFTVWCAPCKALAPTLEDLALEFADQALIVGVDAEQSPAVAKRYDVTGYPTMILMVNGEELSRPQARTRGQLRDVLDAACGIIRDEADCPLPPEDLSLTPELATLLAKLAEVDADGWKKVTERVTELSQLVVDSAPGPSIDETAMTAASTRLANDVEAIATARTGDAARAAHIASAASATFDRWVRRSPVIPTWSAALRTIPAARMSAYLPAGAAPADPSEAAAAFCTRLAELPDEDWIAIRAVNRDVFPFEAMKEHGVTAFLAGVLLVQAAMSADLVPDTVHAAAWAPFEDVLQPSAVLV